jgi:peptide deformylase
VKQSGRGLLRRGKLHPRAAKLSLENMRRLRRTYLGNPVLREKAKPVSLRQISTANFQKLVAQMFFTMRSVGGVGLAAPQIGKPIQLAVIEVKKIQTRPRIVPLEPTVIINPRILSHSGRLSSDWEGCLSFPNVRGLVPRYEIIRVSYFDRFGKKQIKTFREFQARVFQHEIDHLNGLIYTDRIVNLKNLMVLEEFKKRILKKVMLKRR